MLPSQLQAEHFKNYPPEARRLAVSQIELLRDLPACFVPLLLRELISYDWKFPAERNDLDRQLKFLGPLSGEKRKQVMSPFAQLRLPPDLEKSDWVNSPGQYSEQLTAHLWATHQIEAFHRAAVDYLEKVDAASPPEPPPLARLGIAVIGKDVAENKYALFRKLRPHGVHFIQVKPENGLNLILQAVSARAAAHPIPYGHWYIDGGGKESAAGPGLSCVSYDALEAARTTLLKKMEKFIQSGTGGPEALRTMMAQMKPEDIGLSGSAEDAVLNHFQVSVLTEGSGTQIFSTTFVQWTAREALRRAQPVTLLARFAPRQRQRPMNEMLSGKQQKVEVDPAGSLVDADMGAFYNYLNQQRLTGNAQASFLAWFEGHNEALAIAPFLPRGTESDSPIDMKGLLAQIA